MAFDKGPCGSSIDIEVPHINSIPGPFDIGQAVRDLQGEGSDGVHFTAVYSLSKKDWHAIRDRILQLIVESRETALKSPEEELIAMTLDAFRV